MMFTDEILCKQLTRIADALEQIASIIDRHPQNDKPLTPANHLTEKEAAKHLGLSVAWFQRKRWEGNGPPYVKVGSAVRYNVRKLDEWVKQNTASRVLESRGRQTRTEF